MEEWVDLDLQDEQAKQPEPPPDSPDRIRQGKLLFKELGCAGCHDLTSEDTKLAGPDLSFIGSRPVHELDFGNAKIRHALPDFLYTKLKSPECVPARFRAAHLAKAGDGDLAEPPADALNSRIRPPCPKAPNRSSSNGFWKKSNKRASWMRRCKCPQARHTAKRSGWLDELNDSGALSPLKMPDFQLSDEDAEALTIALMSHSEVSIPSKRYEVPQEHKEIFNPQDGFGVLERRYRCLSCHSIRGSGDRRASDLTYEGSRVNREWLYHYLNTPYSMRRTLDHRDAHLPLRRQRLAVYGRLHLHGSGRHPARRRLGARTRSRRRRSGQVVVRCQRMHCLPSTARQRGRCRSKFDDASARVSTRNVGRRQAPRRLDLSMAPQSASSRCPTRWNPTSG